MCKSLLSYPEYKVIEADAPLIFVVVVNVVLFQFIACYLGCVQTASLLKNRFFREGGVCTQATCYRILCPETSSQA